MTNNTTESYIVKTAENGAIGTYPTYEEALDIVYDYLVTTDNRKLAKMLDSLYDEYVAFCLFLKAEKKDICSCDEWLWLNLEHRKIKKYISIEKVTA